MHNCIICNISNKSENSFIVYEDEDFIAFLDIRPLFKGHCLLSPKAHIANIYALPDLQVQPYFLLVKLIGKAVQESMGAKGTFIATNNTVSQMSPYHLHTHLVPRNPKDGLKGFFWPRQKYNSNEEMADIQGQIIQAITSLKNDDNGLK